MKKLVIPLVAACALIVSTNQVRATPLPPGGTVVPGFQSSAGFSVLADTGSQAFNLGDGTTGTLDAQVGTLPGNPNGGLTFIYQFHVSTGLVEHLSSASFASFLTDVAFDNSGGTIAPATVNRSGAFDNGKVVEFNGQWIPGQTSAVLIINTDAKTFTSGTIGIIDGGAQTLVGFAPVTLVPEPASLFLFGSSLLSLGGAAVWRRWRR
jgi:hypothetical protein